jgi:glycine cleavage system H protein
MPEIFHGTFPEDLLYDLNHDMWVRTEVDEVLIGATAFGIHLAGEVIAFTAKPRGAKIARGRGLGTIECAKTVLAVHSPVSFVLTQGNDDLEEHPAFLNQNPYLAWMVRGQPIDWAKDLTQLVSATAYRQHVLHCEPGAIIR